MDSKEDDERGSSGSDVGGVGGIVADHIDVNFPSSDAAPPGDVELGGVENISSAEEDIINLIMPVTYEISENEESPTTVENGEQSCLDPYEGLVLMPLPLSAFDSSAEGIINSIMPVTGEIFENDESPTTVEIGESLMDPSSLSSRPIPTSTANMRVGAFSITPTRQIGDEPSLHVGMETTIPPAQEPMPPPGPNSDQSTNQSLPLLEATLVDEEIYEAFPMTMRMPHKYRVIIIGSVLVAVAAIIAVVVLYSSVTKAIITASPSESSVSPTTAPPTASTPIIPTVGPVASPASAWIWRQQGPAIVGDASRDQLGTSVALSSDAKTLVVGAPGYWENNEKMGYVKIFRANEDGRDRVQLGETIYGDAVGDFFGWSVDVSHDGNTLAIGSPGRWNEERPGYVRVFSLESSGDLDMGSWKQIGQDIVGEANGDEFGISVSLSEDGKTIAVGAPSNNGNEDDLGHVRVYRLDDSGSSWTQLGGDIDGEAAGDYSGDSVSLSADGKTVAIGAPYAGIDEIRTGYVKIYRIDSEGSSWELLGQSIQGDDANDLFGLSVNISPDGNTLAIGSPGYSGDNDGPGYVRVFSLESDNDLGTGSWKQIGDYIIGEGIGDLFGHSVSLSEDGRILAVGAPYNNGNGENSGHVRVYRLGASGLSWTQLGEDIDGQAAGDWSGWSVSLSTDGKTVAIGSSLYYHDGLDSGHVRIFIAE